MRCRTSADPMKPAPPVTTIFMRRSFALSEIRDCQRRERMAVIGEWTGEFLEQRKSPILVRDDDVGILASAMEIAMSGSFQRIPLSCAGA